MKQHIGFGPADLLIPQGVDLSKWSVVACDQYTSQPEYWERVEALVGNAPSALRVTLPEVYLGREDVESRIASINATMDRYLAEGLFREAPGRYLYLERTLGGGAVRRGLLGAVDLEDYDYRAGSASLIRATEGTVLERIPPRVRVRENAALEIPHVMLLIDDREDRVMGPLSGAKEGFEPVYDFPLMMDGGHSRGWLVDPGTADAVEGELARLADPASFAARYGRPEGDVLLFAVGDGNHSLATAKECWRRLKETLPPDQWEGHPARYALVEVVNLHNPSLSFEGIHRVLFDVDASEVLGALAATYDVSRSPCDGQCLRFASEEGEGAVWVRNPPSRLAYGTLQRFLDIYLRDHVNCRVDYIHGEDVALRLGREPGNLVFLMEALPKEELFPTVLQDGALPRKTFSMGHACDKRYYLEARKIR